MKRKYNVTWQSFVLLPAIFAGWTIVTIDGLTGPTIKLVWWMIPIYEVFGYWPTMLLPPILGILCLVALFAVYFRERRREKDGL